ncbi:MAG: Multi antimicrobial extrusion protein (Na(+)/drug antiporter), MATE family of MDR efflux pumps [uncultured Gemmatimonadetes bacterium]|uniref:Multidrug-efflux transporter n=1 Tax=uncultured Gemmatimonadota bacterium TaxID=203437 RepID=A0A6J4K4S7_9BACT|nr:MAG: Multi antimicrobial extrusion protein (Na(+)/drug antiporter), MATE family of MDR efflux pumps [uncultured Gemmatimonadota bacterium]
MLSRLGAETLAGLGMANQVMMILMTLVLGITTGTMALVSRARGACDAAAASHVLRQSLLLALLLSSVVGLAGIALAPWLLSALGAEGAAAQAGTLYLRILLIGLAGVAMDFTLANTLRGVGDSVTPLRTNAAVVVLNIGGTALLVFGPGPFPALGIAGAAAASIGARAVGVAWLWTRLRGGRSGFQWQPGSWSPDRTTIRRILDIGVPGALESIVRTGSSVALMGVVARTGAGTAAIAAHTIGLQMEMFSRLATIGLGTAATSLVGQRVGAGEPRAAERMGWLACAMGVALLGGLGLVTFLLAGPLSNIFSDDPATARLTADYLRTISLAQPLYAMGMVAAGALRGGGDTRFPMWAAAVGGWLFMVPAAWLLGVHLGWGPRAVWLVQALNYAVFAALLTWRFRAGGWKGIRL